MFADHNIVFLYDKVLAQRGVGYQISTDS